MAVSLHKNWPSQIVGILGIVMRWIERATVHMNYENYQHDWQLKERARMLWLRITYLPGKKQLKNREKGFLYKTSIQQQLSECLIGGDRYMERKHHLPPYPGWSPYQKTSTKKKEEKGVVLKSCQQYGNWTWGIVKIKVFPQIQFLALAKTNLRVNQLKNKVFYKTETS